jgi:hypothetical protein
LEANFETGNHISGSSEGLKPCAIKLCVKLHSTCTGTFKLCVNCIQLVQPHQAGELADVLLDDGLFARGAVHDAVDDGQQLVVRLDLVQVEGNCLMEFMEFVLKFGKGKDLRVVWGDSGGAVQGEG